MSAFIASLILVVLTAFVQMTNWLLLGQTIKPNLLLVVVLALLAVNPNWVKRLVIIGLAALVVKEAPGFTPTDLIFPATLVVLGFLLDYLPWQRSITVLLAAFLGTIVMNLQYFTPMPFIVELAMNLLLAFIVVNLLPAHVRQIKLQRNRF